MGTTTPSLEQSIQVLSYIRRHTVAAARAVASIYTACSISTTAATDAAMTCNACQASTAFAVFSIWRSVMPLVHSRPERSCFGLMKPSRSTGWANEQLLPNYTKAKLSKAP